MKLYQHIVYGQIKEQSHVIDLGCGHGELLHALITGKACSGYGIEQSFDSIIQTMAKGIPTFQGDILEGLQQFPSQLFDVAILSQTLQQVYDPVSVITEMCRVAKTAIVTFPNFGHWSVRLQLLTSGFSPKTKDLPYDWFNTPNIRVISINDFRALCKQKSFQILKEIPLVRSKLQRLMFPLGLTNFLTKKGIFVLSKHG